MGFVKELRKFAVKGNVVELAIAVIIGTALEPLLLLRLKM